MSHKLRTISSQWTRRRDACTGCTTTPCRRTRICAADLVNRGLAILGNTLYMGTVDGHLVAVDAKDGQLLWDIHVGDNKFGYGFTEAPLL